MHDILGDDRMWKHAVSCKSLLLANMGASTRILVLIAWLSKEGPGEPTHTHAFPHTQSMDIQCI